MAQGEDVSDSPEEAAVEMDSSSFDVSSGANPALEKFMNENKGFFDKVKNFSPEEKSRLLKAMESGDMEEIKKVLPMDDLLKSGSTSLMVDQVNEMIDAGLGQTSKEELRANLKASSERNPILRSVFTKYPKTLDFTVAWVKDSKARSSFFDILKKKNLMWAFLALNIFLFIAGWKHKRTLKKNDASFGTRFTKGIMRFALVNVIRFGAFYFMFSSELGPSVEIVKDIFFS
jgi:hypothetical protein